MQFLLKCVIGFMEFFIFINQEIGNGEKTHYSSSASPAELTGSFTPVYVGLRFKVGTKMVKFNVKLKAISTGQVFIA